MITEETKEKARKVTALVKAGATVQEAVKQVGWNAVCSYYSARKEMGKGKPTKRVKPLKRRTKVEPIAIPTMGELPFSGGKIFALVGAPQEVMQAIRSML